MQRVSVIIVSWNALAHLQTFLPGVTQSRYENLEIILADNASTDGSKDWVQQHFPGVKIVSFDNNYGYCAGNNRAVPYATGDILIFLNNDVKTDADWITPLIRLFRSRPEVAAVQPKIRSYKHPEKFEYAGAAGGFIDRFGYPFCRGRIFDTIETDKAQYDDETAIFWASGAALAVRKNLFIEAGGFDEDFEFHMEEIDLCWRFWNRGKTVWYCPQSVVYHVGGGSMPSHEPRKLYYNYRNSLAMLFKNYSSPAFYRLYIRFVFDFVAFLREIFSARLQRAGAIIKAYASFIKQLPRLQKKRSAMQRKAVTSKTAPIKPFSIVWQYFVKKVKLYSEL